MLYSFTSVQLYMDLAKAKPKAKLTRDALKNIFLD